MDVVIPHDTILRSLIDFPLQFSVQVQGLTIPSLKPRGKQLVNSSEILKICQLVESASWSIEVLIDEQLSGLKLEAKHFLDYGLITFTFQRIENGKYMLVAEGVKATKSIDLFLRMGRGIGNLAQRNRIWKKRNFEVIAKAPPEYARTLPQMRKTITGDTTLAGSILEREERVPRFLGEHVEDIEFCHHHPDSTHSQSMDSFEYIFLFVLALVIVSFFMVQL